MLNSLKLVVTKVWLLKTPAVQGASCLSSAWYLPYGGASVQCTSLASCAEQLRDTSVYVHCRNTSTPISLVVSWGSRSGANSQYSRITDTAGRHDLKVLYFVL